MKQILHRRVLRPLMRRLTGIQVDHPERLPQQGPAIVVANHNSHIDTALLLAAFPSEVVEIVRPAAAADYWFRNRLVAWFSSQVLGAVPVDRGNRAGDPLAAASAALASGHIVMMFPEGTRGEPGRLGRFRCGVAKLATLHPDAVVVPVWLRGCDQVLPRHRRLPRRYECTVRVGEQVPLVGADPRVGAHELRRRVEALA